MTMIKNSSDMARAMAVYVLIRYNNKSISNKRQSHMTHPHVIQNLYDFLSQNTKEELLKNFEVKTTLDPTDFCCIDKKHISVCVCVGVGVFHI